MLKTLFVFVHSLAALLVSFSTVQSCRKEAADETTVDTVRTGKTYLALGDSYTIGQSVGATERFPYLAASLLRQQNISIADPEYVATTGWTTGNLLSALNGRPLAGSYDAVSLLIGVNDQYQGMDTAGYRTRFTQLLKRAIGFAGNRKDRVFVLSIPDYSATPFVSPSDKAAVSQEIDEFNAINKAVTLQHNVAHVDITPSTREAATDPSLLANDGLHYSGKEHRRWAEKLVPLMKTALQ